MERSRRLCSKRDSSVNISRQHLLSKASLCLMFGNIPGNSGDVSYITTRLALYARIMAAAHKNHTPQ
jgi:hypothetical protein